MNASLIMFVAGGFFAINSYYTATHEVPTKGGSYTEGLLGQPVFINPLIAYNNDVDYTLLKLLFSTLGDISESSAVSTDKKTWTVTLQKNLVWDDGKNLTADDVVFTVETIQDQNAYAPNAPAWNNIIAEKINNDEVRFTLKTPYAFFEDSFKELTIAPKHIFSGIPAANLRRSRYNVEPVGSGPYMLQSMTTEKDGFITRLTLTANPRYHKKPPLIPTFIVQLYRTEQALINDFNVKKIDGLGGLNPERAKELSIGHRLRVFRMPRYYAIFINQNAHPALKEKAVRQALERAVDRAALITDVFQGYAETIQEPLIPTKQGYDTATYPPRKEINIPDIKNELDAHGWLVNPADGIRYKTINKKPVKLRFDIVTPDIPFLTHTMDIIKEAWAAIGVEAKLIVMSPEEINANAIKTRDYQMLIFGNSLKLNPDVFSFWHSSQKFYPGLNLALYDNATANALLESLREESNEAVRKEKVNALKRLIAEDAPALFLYNPSYLYATTENLHGITQSVINAPAERLSKINEWYIKTKRVF